jgi:hypothetical protein
MISEPIRLNHNYKSVKETMMTRGIDIPESYIERAVKELGFERFTEVGLSEVGLTRLVETAIDIYHSEIDLTPRETESYNPIITPVKIEKEKPKQYDQVKEGILKRTGKEILKTITYPTLGCTCLIPTMIRKNWELTGPEFFGAAIIGSWISNIILWNSLIVHNQKLIPYVLGTQIATNLVSLFYEVARHAKKTGEERIE